jgi:integrase
MPTIYIDYCISYREPAMPAKTITDAFVRNVKPPKQSAKHNQTTYIHTLERGLALVLVVSYGGTKSFRVLTYRNGKPHSVKLGTYPAMTVKEARRLAREYWENPEKFAEQKAVGTFKEISDQWLRHHVEAKRLISAAEIRRHLDVYVLRKWGTRKFLEIRRREVNDLMDYIADKHGRVQADAVLATLRSIMVWYQARDENYVSPIVKGMRKAEHRGRERTLNETEIKLVWDAAGQCGSFGALVKLLLLTAQRRDVVGHMRWTDIEADGTCVISPSSPRKKGDIGKVRLPQLALDIIHAQPKVLGNSFVFAGRNKGVAFNSWGQRKAELDKLLPDMAHWTLHDLRRTARILLSGIEGVHPDHAERVLGHKIPGMRGVYDRASYFDEKSKALQLLANKIVSIIDPPPSNVLRPSFRAS